MGPEYCVLKKRKIKTTAKETGLEDSAEKEDAVQHALSPIEIVLQSLNISFLVELCNFATPKDVLHMCLATENKFIFDSGMRAVRIRYNEQEVKRNIFSSRTLLKHFYTDDYLKNNLTEDERQFILENCDNLSDEDFKYIINVLSLDWVKFNRILKHRKDITLNMLDYCLNSSGSRCRFSLYGLNYDNCNIFTKVKDNSLIEGFEDKDDIPGFMMYRLKDEAFEFFKRTLLDRTVLSVMTPDQIQQVLDLHGTTREAGKQKGEDLVSLGVLKNSKYDYSDYANKLRDSPEEMAVCRRLLENGNCLIKYFTTIPIDLVYEFHQTKMDIFSSLKHNNKLSSDIWLDYLEFNCYIDFSRIQEGMLNEEELGRLRKNKKFWAYFHESEDFNDRSAFLLGDLQKVCTVLESFIPTYVRYGSILKLLKLCVSNDITESVAKQRLQFCIEKLEINKGWINRDNDTKEFYDRFGDEDSVFENTSFIYLFLTDSPFGRDMEFLNLADIVELDNANPPFSPSLIYDQSVFRKIINLQDDQLTTLNSPDLLIRLDFVRSAQIYSRETTAAGLQRLYFMENDSTYQNLMLLYYPDLLEPNFIRMLLRKGFPLTFYSKVMKNNPNVMRGLLDEYVLDVCAFMNEIKPYIDSGDESHLSSAKRDMLHTNILYMMDVPYGETEKQFSLRMKGKRLMLLPDPTIEIMEKEDFQVLFDVGILQRCKTGGTIRFSTALNGCVHIGGRPVNPYHMAFTVYKDFTNKAMNYYRWDWAELEKILEMNAEFKNQRRDLYYKSYDNRFKMRFYKDEDNMRILDIIHRVEGDE